MLSAAVMVGSTGPYQQAGEVRRPTTVAAPPPGNLREGPPTDQYLELDVTGGALWGHRLVQHNARLVHAVLHGSSPGVGWLVGLRLRAGVAGVLHGLDCGPTAAVA